MARIRMMYSTTTNQLTLNNNVSKNERKKTYSIVCYDFGENLTCGNRDVIQTIYNGSEKDLPVILQIIVEKHPKAKIELYINQFRLCISSITNLLPHFLG